MAMTARRTLTVILALTGGLALAGCETFDLDNIFNQKKPLPGDRRAVFPEGVPGVQQGVPAELVRGHQPVAEAPPAPEPEKPKPKPPRRAAAPARPASSVTVQPAQQQSASQQQPARQAPSQQPGQSAGWPEPPATASQPPSSTTVWPDPPRPGTTAR